MREPPSRDDNETTTARCPICNSGFTPIRRQRYCTNACRQIAYRRRHHSADPVEQLPSTRHRDTTVYTCDHCEQRYLGQQWCPDCNRPCRRVGPGGICPHCDEPVAIQDLINITMGGHQQLR
ncbi:MAG TPA: hypothetical protein VNO31_15040 [Umezawaea sp.]|jgi:hypothetical protein|nr:hypothetical protein [Candidatus Limnocylindria bacterium]HWO61343.1 hypothetical protein [Umezawaea sp.]